MIISGYKKKTNSNLKLPDVETCRKNGPNKDFFLILTILLLGLSHSDLDPKMFHKI